MAVLIKKKWKSGIIDWKEISDRIIHITIRIYESIVDVIGVYAPNNDASGDEKRAFYDDLREVVDECLDGHELLLMGDFNGRVGRKINDDVVGNWGEDTENDNGKRLIEFCKEQECVIMNTKFKHKDIHKYTWINPSRNLKSIIDYVIVR